MQQRPCAVPYVRRDASPVVLEVGIVWEDAPPVNIATAPFSRLQVCTVVAPFIKLDLGIHVGVTKQLQFSYLVCGHVVGALWDLEISVVPPYGGFINAGQPVAATLSMDTVSGSNPFLCARALTCADRPSTLRHKGWLGVCVHLRLRHCGTFAGCYICSMAGTRRLHGY